MIKKVSTDKLRVGVFIHDFNCGVQDRNVFINKTLIKTEKAIRIIRSWGINEVYIDTEQGLDIDDSISTIEIPRARTKTVPKKTGEIFVAPPTTPIKEEIKVASGIKREAVDLLQRATRAIQKGENIDIAGAYNLIEKMEASVSRNKEALLLLTRMRNKDEYTLMHSISVSSMVLAFCSSNNVNHGTSIKLAIGALFHDIGKTLIPLSILNKPGKLDQNEFSIIQRHTELSVEILSKTKELPVEAFDIALHHHEKFDGSGYPHGLKGNDIQFGSKLAAICDIYDAITSERCYKKGVDRVTGLQKIYELSGPILDQDIAHDFIRFIGVYPIGTIVKLENELLAVVIESSKNLLQPIVRIFYDDKRNIVIPIEDVDLSKKGIKISCYEVPSNWSGEKRHTFEKIKSALSPLF